jgi:hypothetical protein
MNIKEYSLSLKGLHEFRPADVSRRTFGPKFFFIAKSNHPHSHFHVTLSRKIRGPKFRAP